MKWILDSILIKYVNNFILLNLNLFNLNLILAILTAIERNYLEVYSFEIHLATNQGIMVC